jgi:hypothetical protein
MTRGQFYTEVDIIDMVRAGTRTLTLAEDDRITDVARERAIKEGFRIDRPPTEAAKRPEYQVPGGRPAQKTAGSPEEKRQGLEARVRASVIAKLGDSVDAQLIQDVIHRVLDQLGVH